MSTISNRIPLILGAGNFLLDPSRIKDQREIIEVARNNDIKEIDTSRHYVRHPISFVFCIY